MSTSSNLVRRVLLTLTSATALLAPVASHAGADSGLPASCTFNADGSGSCYGTLAGFRFSPDAGNYITLQTYTDANLTERGIAVRYNGVYKWIFINPSYTHVWKAFDNAGAVSGAYVYFHWNTVGVADVFQVSNSSAYYRGN